MFWDQVFNNPSELVWRGVFSQVGVPKRRPVWKLTSSQIAALAATAPGSGRHFHVLEHYVGHVLMQDAGNNVRQGLKQLMVKLIGGGQVANTSKAVQDVTSLFFAPVSQH
jgi:hypothetical protein